VGLRVTDYSSAELTAIAVQVLIVLLVIRRSYRMTQGVRYSVARLVLLPILVLFLWGLIELESLLLTPWAVPYLIVADLAIVVATTFGFAGVAERMTHVERRDSGEWWYQIGFSLAALFAVLFVVRLAVALVLFPSSLEYGSTPGGFPPLEQQWVIAVIDAMFSASVGLLLGRSLGIHRRVLKAEAATGPGSS
jgi:hypothetical protein